MDGFGDFNDPGVCDVISNDMFVHTYECDNIKCQMDPEVTVSLECDCFVKRGPISQVVPCEWKFKDDVTCPEIPETQQNDWSCDPRTEKCPEGQYGLYGAETLIEEKQSEENISSEVQNDTDEKPETEIEVVENSSKGGLGDVSSINGAITINISPEINQQIGDISPPYNKDKLNFQQDQYSEEDDETIQENVQVMDYIYLNNGKYQQQRPSFWNYFGQRSRQNNVRQMYRPNLNAYGFDKSVFEQPRNYRQSRSVDTNKFDIVDEKNEFEEAENIMKIILQAQNVIHELENFDDKPLIDSV